MTNYKVASGFLTTEPANVGSFGGQSLGPSSYTPVTYDLHRRPSNSTGVAYDLNIGYANQTSQLKHADLVNPNPILPLK